MFKKLTTTSYIAYILNGVRESLGKDELQYQSDSTGYCLIVVNPWPNFSQLIASCHLKDEVTYTLIQDCQLLVLQEGEIRHVQYFSAIFYVHFRNSREGKSTLGMGNPNAPHPLNKSLLFHSMMRVRK